MIHPNHTKTVPKPTQGIAMSCQTPEALPMCTLGSVKYVPKSHFQQQIRNKWFSHRNDLHFTDNSTLSMSTVTAVDKNPETGGGGVSP